MVTKSGVNTLHGDAFLFGQSGVFSARSNWRDVPQHAFTLEVSGRFLSRGPLVKDRTFYYAAAEREQAQTETARISSLPRPSPSTAR